MKKIWYYLCAIVGVLALWLFIDHISGFEEHEYFFIQNPGIEKYCGTNVVSPWADFAFFTYHTLIFFGIWLIGIFLSFILRSARLRNFFTHEATVVFILTNYTITCVLYTAFELLGGSPTFGLYALNSKAIHNLGTNILAHYVFYIFALLIGFKVRTNHTMKRKHVIIIILYLLLYCLSVKITGKYCYRIEWYPYPIFDAQSLWGMLGLQKYEPLQGNILLIFVYTALLVGYILLLLGFRRLKRKQLKSKIDKI